MPVRGAASVRRRGHMHVRTLWQGLGCMQQVQVVQAVPSSDGARCAARGAGGRAWLAGKAPVVRASGGGVSAMPFLPHLWSGRPGGLLVCSTCTKQVPPWSLRRDGSSRRRRCFWHEPPALLAPAQPGSPAPAHTRGPLGAGDAGSGAWLQAA